jgi:hypothetical protein
MLRTWQRRLPAHQRVRPVLGDHRLVAKRPEGSRQRVGRLDPPTFETTI